MTDQAPIRPPALTLAALVVAVQGIGLVGLGVVGLIDVVPSRVEVGVSVAVFFGAYGAVLVACAVALSRCQSWARGPVLLTQLIQLGIAWNARGNTPIAVLLAVLALTAIAAMLHPASIRVLLGYPDELDDQ